MAGRIRIILILLLGVGLFAHRAATASPTDARWQPDFGPAGVNGPVYAAYTQGTNLYVGGRFTLAGGVPARNVARFDGHRWYPLGDGVDGTVRALTGDYEGRVYVGGAFTQAGVVPAQNIAVWELDHWAGLGMGVSGPVATLATYGLTLYVGGKFATAGGQAANGIAQWNAAGWSAFGSPDHPGVDGEVAAIVLENGNSFYIGGHFAQAGGVPAASVARWDGTVWQAVGGGVYTTNTATPTPGRVNALAWADQVLTVAGQFQLAGTVPAGNIAQFGSGVWSGFAEGIFGGPAPVVYGLLRGGSILVVAGTFTRAGQTPVSGTAKWDYEQRQWLPLSTDIDGPAEVHVIDSSSGGSVVIAGDFATAGGVLVNNVAYWDGGNSFTSLGQGVSGEVHALEVVNNNLYVGGQFERVAGALANGVAVSGITYPRWLGVGAGVNGLVRTLASSEYRLLVGGDFTEAAGAPAAGFAITDGASWSGDYGGVTGLQPGVFALGSLGDDRTFYVGGRFSAIGGVAAQNVARLAGNVWSALGAGVDGPVNVVLIDGAKVIVGGAFTHAGGLSAAGVAQWDTRTEKWSTWGEGIGSTRTDSSVPVVNAILRVGTRFFVGGDFNRAGGQAANSLASWDGTAWQPVGGPNGNGIDGTVRALVAHGDKLFIGGEFSRAGGVSDVANVVVWDGTEFAGLGTGTDGPVRALAVHFNTLFLGGSFHAAGGQPAYGLARWLIDAPPNITLTAPAANSSFAYGETIPVTVSLSGFVPPPVRVTFYYPPNPLIVVSNPPFSTVLSNLVAGQYGLTAYAYDARGDSVYSPDISLTIQPPASNQPPSVVLVQPLTGGRYGVGQIVTLTADAEDPDGTVDHVEFYLGNSFQNPLGSVTNPPYTLSLPFTFPAEYSFVARAIDNQGASAVSTNRVVVTFTATNFPPTVVWEDPFDGAVLPAGTLLPLMVAAGDRDGQIARVDLFANGDLLASFQGNIGPTFSFSWMPPAAGDYELTAKVRDNAGAPTSSTLRISVVDPEKLMPPRVVAGPDRRLDYPVVNGPVNALAERDGILYLGGAFTEVGGLPRHGLAAFDLRNGTVTPWQSDCDGVVHALVATADTLFVGGLFNTVNGAARKNLAALDLAGNLRPPLPEVDGAVFVLSGSLDGLYLGGAFNHVGGVNRPDAAAVDPVRGIVLPWDPRPNGAVRAIQAVETAVYLGGDFTALHGLSRSHLAAVDLGGGLPLEFEGTVDGSVFALTATGTTLYIGGEFPTVAGKVRSRLAALDRTTGHPTGWTSAADGTVRALVAGAGVLYVGGDFGQVGGAIRTGLAALDVRRKFPNALAGFPAPAEATVPATVNVLGLGPLALYVGGTQVTNNPGRWPFRAYDLPLRFAESPSRGPGPLRWTVFGPAGRLVQVQASGDLQQWQPLMTNLPPFVLEVQPESKSTYRAVGTR